MDQKPNNTQAKELLLAIHIGLLCSFTFSVDYASLFVERRILLLFSSSALSPAASGQDSSWPEDLLRSRLPGAFTGRPMSRVDINGSSSSHSK